MFNIIDYSILFYENSLHDILLVFDEKFIGLSLILKLDDLIERDDNMKEIFIEIKNFK